MGHGPTRRKESLKGTPGVAHPVKAVLLLGGAPPPASARAECAGALVIAVDGGAALAAEWGVRPDEIVGDMDSIPPDLLARYEQEGVKVQRHPRMKDETDARLALDRALKAGADEIVFLGATGRRLDHTVANLQLIRSAAMHGPLVRALEADARLVAVTSERPFGETLPKGAVLSVLSLTDRTEGVLLQGLTFPLRDATLVATEPLGISNSAQGGPVKVSCRKGVLLVVLPS